MTCSNCQHDIYPTDVVSYQGAYVTHRNVHTCCELLRADRAAAERHMNERIAEMHRFLQDKQHALEALGMLRDELQNRLSLVEGTLKHDYEEAFPGESYCGWQDAIHRLSATVTKQRRELEGESSALVTGQESFFETRFRLHLQNALEFAHPDLLEALERASLKAHTRAVGRLVDKVSV